MTWTTKNGMVLEIASMESSHLLNAYKMMQRVVEKREQQWDASFCGGFNGEMAQYYAGLEETEAHQRWLVSLLKKNQLEQEINKRGLL